MDARKPGVSSPPRTLLGHLVVSRYEALNLRIREDLLTHGSRAPLPSSPFRLQALYLDFGRGALAEGLVDAVLRATQDARDAAGLPREDLGPQEAERQFFDNLGGTDSAHVGQRLVRLSRRALTAVFVFDAHFWNLRLALEVVGGEGRLEEAAVGTCAFVAERRVGRSMAGDLQYYAPLREQRKAFCFDHCLPAIGLHPSDDRACVPPRTPADCGMLRTLEGFRFFASFPDE